MSLSLVSVSTAFQGPALRAAPRAAPVVNMASLSELPGAGPETFNKVWDPLGLSDMCPYGSMNYEWMRTAEVKHGRVCMAASVGWIINEAGIHFPGEIAKGVTFESLGQGQAAWAAVPIEGKCQILAFCGLVELGVEIKKPHYLNAGMITFDTTTRKGRGRIAELKNGRAAMIAVASFFAATAIPGSVPALPSTWV